MGPYDTVEEYTEKSEGYVEHVRIRKTDDDKCVGTTIPFTTGRQTAKRCCDTITHTSARKGTSVIPATV
jgi:hypothetical protein